MDAFLTNAANIFEAAEAAAAHHDPENWTLLLKPNGGLHMIAASDWSLDALAREHNATSVYRVSHSPSRVTVDCHAHGRFCRLSSTPASQAARFLLGA